MTDPAAPSQTPVTMLMELRVYEYDELVSRAEAAEAKLAAANEIICINAIILTQRLDTITLLERRISDLEDELRVRSEHD